MAQSEATVTPPNPTPPTNMPSTGITGPNPPNYTKVNYAEPFGARDANGVFTDETPPGVRVNVNPPPFPATQVAGALTAFAANASALAGGTGATSGGTEGTYPGTGTTAPYYGAVPASSSLAHEGAGLETVVTAPGSRTECPTQAVKVGTALTQAQVDGGPNALHPSAKAPAVLPTITNLAPNNQASGPGTLPSLTLTGTGYRMDSVVNIAGVPYTTSYISATSLKVMNPPRRSAAGTLAVTVVTGGTATAPSTWTFT